MNSAQAVKNAGIAEEIFKMYGIPVDRIRLAMLSDLPNFSNIISINQAIEEFGPNDIKSRNLRKVLDATTTEQIENICCDLTPNSGIEKIAYKYWLSKCETADQAYRAHNFAPPSEAQDAAIQKIFELFDKKK